MPYRAIIIGAGQAGLAAAHELRRRGFTFGPDGDVLVLDANPGPGGAWQHRWDSLTLGKAHGVADLPGLPMSDPDPAIPASRLVADYYGTFEAEFDLRVLRPAPVRSVAPAGPVLEVTLIDGRVFPTELVLNATGTWDNPYLPYVPGMTEFLGTQLHTRDYVRKEDFAGKKVIVIGGGLSAVQFLLELAPVAETVWATHRPPAFRADGFDDGWGLAVERRVRERTLAGKPASSVVSNTGIPQNDDYLAGVADGTLVSRGMFDRVTPTGVIFGEPKDTTPSSVPDSWDPLPVGTEMDADVLFWNTGFRPSMRHLAPMKLRHSEGGVLMLDEVTPAVDERILLVGYGSAASTVGANRAGRLAGRKAARLLSQKVESAA